MTFISQKIFFSQSLAILYSIAATPQKGCAGEEVDQEPTLRSQGHTTKHSTKNPTNTLYPRIKIDEYTLARTSTHDTKAMKTTKKEAEPTEDSAKKAEQPKRMSSRQSSGAASDSSSPRSKTLKPSCLSACLPACLSACLPVCLPACLPVCLSACLPACLPACLLVSIHVCVSVL